MIYFFVKIYVKNFSALEKFEHAAAKIMLEYNGKILTAFETLRNPDGSGEEIHLLEFQSSELFEQYRHDARYFQLKILREQAISSIEIKISHQLKYYG